MLSSLVTFIPFLYKVLCNVQIFHAWAIWLCYSMFQIAEHHFPSSCFYIIIVLSIILLQNYTYISHACGDYIILYMHLHFIFCWGFLNLSSFILFFRIFKYLEDLSFGWWFLLKPHIHIHIYYNLWIIYISSSPSALFCLDFVLPVR